LDQPVASLSQIAKLVNKRKLNRVIKHYKPELAFVMECEQDRLLAVLESLMGNDPYIQEFLEDVRRKIQC
jgi:hypothetical protein